MREHNASAYVVLGFDDVVSRVLESCSEPAVRRGRLAAGSGDEQQRDGRRHERERRRGTLQCAGELRITGRRGRQGDEQRGRGGCADGTWRWQRRCG
jgi:hypothetical protein